MRPLAELIKDYDSVTDRLKFYTRKIQEVLDWQEEVNKDLAAQEVKDEAASKALLTAVFSAAEMKTEIRPMFPEERFAYEKKMRESPKYDMSLSNFYEEADAVQLQIQNEKLASYEDCETFRQNFLSRRGRIAELFDNLRFIEASKRRDYGIYLNLVKVQAQQVYDEGLFEAPLKTFK